jgi:DNA-binding transcriptional LysR family regulator
VKLLTRTTRSLALTEEGARYFERVRRLLAEIAWTEGDCSGEQQLTGWLRVAASTRYREAFVPSRYLRPAAR